MKRLIISAALILAALTGASFNGSASDKAPIGYSHRISFGAAYGYGGNKLANFGSAFLDINIPTANLPKNSYFRTRLEANFDEITNGLSTSAGASFQYMQPIAGTFYVYPFVRLKAEYHNTPIWSTKADFLPGLGVGLEYQFTSFIGAFVQGAYEYGFAGKAGRPIIQVGCAFAFGK